MTDETPKTPEIKEPKEPKTIKEPKVPKEPKEVKEAREIKEPKKVPFGTRLLAAREAMGLDRKDVAHHLRLSEKIIYMMENERYSSDLPITFVRGYLRAYAKFLQIPDTDINKGLEPFQHKPTPTNVVPLAARNLDPVTRDHYYMQIFSYIIGVTLLGLVGTWGYTHYSANNKIVIESVINTADNAVIKTTPPPIVATTNIATPPATAPTAIAPIVNVAPVVANEQKTVVSATKETKAVIAAVKAKPIEPVAENEDDESYGDDTDTTNSD